MRQPLLLISLSLAALLPACVLAQNQVTVEFQTDPVLVQTGTDIVFTVRTSGQIFSISWQYQGPVLLGTWIGGRPEVNAVPQFQGRVSITATQLRIGSARLEDAGSYTVEVAPEGGGTPVVRSAQLRVFDAVFGLALSVPDVSVEGRNVTLQCTWTAGTEIAVQWGKDGATVTADSSITISGGTLVINPARRSDAGEYTCTASNPVSVQNAGRSLTVFYGPDTPVLTLEAPKDCVGEGDVMVGQTVRITCASESLPPALFSWQHDGQSVAPSPPDSGTLSLQTFSTNQSGRYVCTARNAVTEGTSEQSRDLAVVDVCFSGGEVAGIVIGALLALLLLILLIVLIIVLVRRKRVRQRNSVLVRETTSDPRITAREEPQPNGVRREPDRGRNPPLFYTQPADRLNAAPRGNRGDPRTPQLNGLQNSDTHQHNGRARTNGLQHNGIQNTNSYPHNGIDNQAFTHTDAQNANTLPSTQQQNPNILIQPGAVQGGAQPPAVQVSLNTLPQAAQANNNNAQMPTIHVNLNSYPTNGQPNQQGGGSFAPSNNAPQVQNTTRAAQQNADTQTYQQGPESYPRNGGTSRGHGETPSSSRRQMPWDRFRGTPAYPNDARDGSDYSADPPVREARPPNLRPQPQGQTVSRSRTPPRRDGSQDGNIWSRLADLRRSTTNSVAQLTASRRSQKSSGTQTENAQADMRDLPGNQSAPRQEVTRSSNPQALSLMSQQASAGHSAALQRPTAQQALTALRGVDSRALADPNHLQQAHMALQHSAAPIQTLPQGLGTQTQPVTSGANQARQSGTAPAPHPSSAQPNPNNLTQAALRAHTEKAQVFKNRRDQTQAALLRSGPQARAPAAGGQQQQQQQQQQQPPRPPPVIPLTQFQTLPKERTQQRSPTRAPQPLRPPVNVPTAQRPHHHRPANHHHRPANGHRHGHVQGQGHGQPAHFTQPWQQQAHKGRPR